MGNKKGTNTDMDEIDSILAGLDNDSMEIEDDDSDERGSVGKVVKNVKKGFLDSFTSDPKGKMIKFVDNAMPKSIEREMNFFKETSSEVMKVYEKSSNELKSGMKSTIDIVQNKINQDSKLHKFLGKISKKLEVDEATGASNKGPSEDDLISNTLTELFTKGKKIDEITDKVKDIKENKKFEHHTLQNNRLISSVESISKFHQEYTLNYYKKSIELKLKTLFVNKELLEVTKTSSETAIRQFEAIVKNTSLPDLVKYKNTEQLGETIHSRMRENMADMFLSAARPLEVLKTNMVGKVQETIDNVLNGLNMGVTLHDTVSMSGGISSMAGNMAGEKLQDTVASMVSQKLEDMPYIRKMLKKTKLFMADPTDTFFDLADENEEKNTVMSRNKSRLFRMLGFMSQTKDVENKRFIEGHPDQETMFDYKTKNSIVKIIPSLLGKIYGAVESIRTGKEPDNVYYDYTTGKIEKSSGFKKSIEDKIGLALDTNVKGEMDKFLSIIDKDNEFSDKTSKNIKSAIINHLTRGGGITPKALIKEDFLKTLGKDADIFKSKLGTIIDPNNDEIDAMTMGDLSDILYSIKTNTPHIDSLIKEYYTNGQIEDVIKAGLVNYDPMTGAYTVNKDNYGKLIQKLITKTTFSKSGARAKLRSGIGSFGKDGRIKEELSREDIKAEIFKSINPETRKKLKVKLKLNNVPTSISSAVDSSANDINNNIFNNYEDRKKWLYSNKESYLHSMYPNKNNVHVNKALVPYGVNTETEKEDGTLLSRILKSTRVSVEDMHKAFVESGGNLLGNTMDGWAKSLGYRNVNGKYEKIAEDNRMENIKKTLFEHLSGYVKNFTEKTGIKNSVYKIFELEPGMTPLMILHKILNKTRAWDRKIVSSIPKAIWKSVKGTYNLSKKVLKGGYRGVFNRNTKNLLRVLFGNAPIYDDDDTGSKVGQKVHETLNKTRSWDRQTMKDLPGNIWGGLKGIWKGGEKASGKVHIKDKLWDTLRVFGGFDPRQKFNTTETAPDYVKRRMSEDSEQGIYNSAEYYYKEYKDKFGDMKHINNTQEKTTVFEDIQNTEMFKDIKNKAEKNKYYKWAKDKFNNFQNSDTFKDTKSKAEDLYNSSKDKVKEHSLYKDAMKIAKDIKDGKYSIEDIEKLKTTKIYTNFKTMFDTIIDSVNSFNFTNNTNNTNKTNTNLPAVLKNIETYLKPKEKKFGDRDNDGDVDNNWEDRLNNKKTTVKDIITPTKTKSKGIWGFLKDKLLWIGGILAATLSKLGPLRHLLKIVPAIKWLGTAIATGKLVGGIGRGIKGIGNIAKTAWNGAKVVGGALAGKKIVSAAASGFDVNNMKTVLDKGKAPTKLLTSTASKVSGGGLLAILKSFKDTILKKVGPNAGAKLIATLGTKIGARIVPIAGAALLAYDVGAVTYLMVKDGLSLKSAISKHILGFDLFDDNDAAKDEDGNLIKPDEKLEENEAIKPEVEEYVRKLMAIAKEEIRTGIKDTKGRLELVELKKKHNLDDKEIEKAFKKLKAEDDAKFANQNKNNDLDNVKSSLENKTKPTTTTTTNSKPTEPKIDNSYDSSIYNSKENSGGAKTYETNNKMFNKMLDERDTTIKNDLVNVNVPAGNFTVKGKEEVLSMLDEVAKTTGVDANLLKTFAAIESSFNPRAGAGTSTAKGLFQFINDTWTGMLDKYGKKYGLSPSTSVYDPRANALMGAEFLKENQKGLKSINRGNSPVELYLAHFLGLGGARRLFSAPEGDPANLHVDEKSIRANYDVFYKNGKIRTVRDIIAWAANLVKTKLKKAGISTSTSEPIGRTDTTPKVDTTSTLPEVKVPENTQPDNVTTNVVPEVPKTNYTPTEVTTPVSTDNISGINPNAKTVIGKVDTSPMVTTTSNNMLENGLPIDILKDSLKVQISMEKHLKSIVDVLLKNATQALVPQPQNANSNNEMAKAISNKNPNLSMPNTLLDLTKKRYI